MQNRKFVPIWKAAEVAEAINPETGKFEWAMVEIDNMGFCKDGVTRWYHFTAADGTPCYTLKHGTIAPFMKEDIYGNSYTGYLLYD